MCKENCTEINLSSSVFNEMRDNFDAILKKGPRQHRQGQVRAGRNQPQADDQRDRRERGSAETEVQASSV